MKKRILFGTTSQAKIDHIHAFLESLPLEILSPRDLNIAIDVKENGASPEENAEKKARAYFAAAHIPTFAIDAGLDIEEFSDEKRPGVFVRRIHREDRDATDREILDYYVQELAQVGGESIGTWRVAIVLMVSPNQVWSSSYSLSTILTAKASPVLLPGAPLCSLTIDPATGKYYSEMTYRERPDSQYILDIMKQHLDKL